MWRLLLALLTPAPSKDTDESVHDLQKFIGDDAVKRTYSDNADELMRQPGFSGYRTRHRSRACLRRVEA